MGTAVGCQESLQDNPDRMGGPCTTVSGKVVGAPCVFPFTYKDTSYTSCKPSVGSKKSWCSTKTDSSGVYVSGYWGYCPSGGCPTGENKFHGPQSGSTDEIVVRVQGYIDAGTCGTVFSSYSCDNSATSYYNEIIYGGKRVIISNQVPDHDHEHDMLVTNPNKACERYQFISLPIDPAKTNSPTRTAEGSIGT